MANKRKISDKSESDDEFLKRFAKINEDAKNKVRTDTSYSKEIEEYKQKGKQAGKEIEEIDRCNKIIEEFKINPPVLTTKSVNDLSVESEYDTVSQKKIESLKGRASPPWVIRKSTLIYAPNFKTFGGRAYVKRRGQRIPLPENSEPPCDTMGMGKRLLDPKSIVFVLENGDIIETEDDSYVQVSDFISTDKYQRKIFIYPNSAVSLNLTREESHSQPEFMEPSKVPDVVKRNSSTTVINFNFATVSLIKGIFHVYALEENKDVNGFLKQSSGYPDIEFLHSSKMMDAIADKLYAKAPQQIIAAFLAKKSKSTKVCDEISAFIELCEDNSVVIFGTGNSVKNKSTGKIASPKPPIYTPKDFVITAKIIVMGDRIYSDSSTEPDPRARAIIKNKFAMDQYLPMLAAKKETEDKLKEIKAKAAKPKVESEASRKEREKRIAELLEEQKYMKQVGDKEMAEGIQMQIDELDPEKMAARNPEAKEEELIKVIGMYNREIDKLRSDLNTNFPQYSPINEADLV